LYSIIVVPPPTTEGEHHRTQIRLAPGERLSFGRAPANDLPIRHGGVSRRAGELGAQGAFWTLSNLSVRHTYVVENPEGAGEHIKIGPGRLDAPVPFEFSRIVLPAAGDLPARGHPRLHPGFLHPRRHPARAAVGGDRRARPADPPVRRRPGLRRARPASETNPLPSR
jgi:hypothetical protein